MGIRNVRFSRFYVLGTAILFAITIRILFMQSRGDMFVDDPDSYARFALSLAETGVFGPDGTPSAYRPPFYVFLLLPWVSSAGLSATGVAVLHLIATTIIVAATWLCGIRFFDLRTANVAAFLVSVDPLLVNQSALVMTEVVFSALLMGLIVAWQSPRRNRAIVSILLASLVLTRPTGWAIWGLWLLTAWRQRQVRDWLICTIAGLVLCVPWIVRNQIAFGKPIVTTTHGGYTLWLGNNPEFYGEVVSGRHVVWPEASFERFERQVTKATAGLSEVEADAKLRLLAIRWMSEHPGAALQTMLHHFWSMWRPAPRAGSNMVKLVSGIFYIILYFAALPTLFNECRNIKTEKHSNRRLELVLVVVALTFIHLFYWSNVRMRTPAVPVLALLAARFVGISIKRFGNLIIKA